MGKYFRGNKIKACAGCTLLLGGVALLVASAKIPSFAQWYSVHIYPVWVGSMGRFAGLFPCSLSEILLYILVIWIVCTGAAKIWRVRKKKESRQEICAWFLSLFLIAGVLLFLYAANCGVNYHRESFAESSGLELGEYKAEELKEVCLWLAEEVNDLCGEVMRDGDGVMDVDAGVEKADEEVQEAGKKAYGSREAVAVTAMQSLGTEYPEFAGYYPEPKGLFFSWILSVQNLTGIYLPFTVEANYNTDMTDYNIPFTMCHELSHLRGFMQEEEANFIAFLACRASEVTEFRYSGNLMGWIYCMNALRKADYEMWEEVRATLLPAVEADLRANSAFWEKYDGAVAEVSNKVNDTYLKANGQANGVKSYGRMVDLVTAYRRNESGRK